MDGQTEDEMNVFKNLCVCRLVAVEVSSVSHDSRKVFISEYILESLPSLSSHIHLKDGSIHRQMVSSSSRLAKLVTNPSSFSLISDSFVSMFSQLYSRQQLTHHRLSSLTSMVRPNVLLF